MGKKRRQDPIPVFFGFDERFKPYAYVAISSLLKNCDNTRNYHIHILHDGLAPETVKTFKQMERENARIYLHDISNEVKVLVSHLPVRDYYSVSTYFRIVIANKFPQYDKALYIDSDTVVVGDISKLYDIKLHKKLLAGVREEVMKIKETKLYAEKVVGVKIRRYFNAGMILINSRQWRREKVLDQFVELASFYDFTIAQDQDYLNVICKHKTKKLPRRWNMEAIHSWKIPKKQIGIIHYAFCAKPWHDNTVAYADYFWEYAKGTPYFMEIKKAFSDHTMEMLAEEAKATERVFENCMKEVNRPDNYQRRLEALEKARREEARMAAGDE